MFSDDISEPYSSREVLIHPPKRDKASPLYNYSDDLDRALDGGEEDIDSTTFIWLHQIIYALVSLWIFFFTKIS